ncbi:hypothetical protein C483_12998 [Natrialba hulunbeirensis JCM 10989]|uniref:Uncharacterized protein n=1 Tax=Natrialba hulunbeirensis JCM 10989 TaxID=1227493 RepID=L9ZVA4_9EURY|nr:hypothetical protein C483_12998 [Natrialba hulunbeirensis JCM 10989]
MTESIHADYLIILTKMVTLDRLESTDGVAVSEPRLPCEQVCGDLWWLLRMMAVADERRRETARNGRGRPVVTGKADQRPVDQHPI